MQSKQLLLLLLTAISGVMSQQNIVDTLTSGGLNSLLDTIKQYPDLVDTLSKAEKLTVFAPTDAAFQKLQASPAWATIKDDKEAIKQILLYHVSDSLIESKDIKDGTTIVDTLVDANYKAFRNLTEDDEQVVKVVKDGNEVVLKSRFEQESKVTKAVSDMIPVYLFWRWW